MKYDPRPSNDGVMSQTYAGDGYFFMLCSNCLRSARVMPDVIAITSAYVDYLTPSVIENTKITYL